MWFEILKNAVLNRMVVRQREEREEMVRQQAEELKKQAEELKKQLKKQEDMEKELNELRHKTPRPNHSGRPTLTKILF